MKSRQSGMTLIEVLIAIVVLAVGLLGIASMLMLSSKANTSSYTKQQAVQAVYDIFDRIRANSQAAIGGNYNISNIGASGPTAVSAPSAMCNSGACTPAQLASYDMWWWLTKDVARLPNGCGSVSTALAGAAGNTVVTVTVQWDDSPAQANLGATSTTSAVNANFVQITVQSQL